MNQPAILCVDDDPDFLDLMCRAVGRSNAVVVGAPSAESALIVYDMQPVSLIVTDICLPRGDGLGLIASLRKRSAKLPILALTGARELLVAAVRAGASACLLKPLDLALLRAHVARLLRPSLAVAV
jgi:DNA-binding response OmpR family regulator